MKRYLLILGLILGFTLVGCTNSNFVPKTEYSVNEEAMIDDLYLTVTNAKYESDTLEVTFNITNKTGNTYTLNPDNNFRLYDINRVLVNNIYSNNSNIIKKGQTISYTLQYNINKKEIYELYFYSGIVENNIKFVITGNDLK